MLLIEHRVNTLEQLQRVPPERGVEVDIRDYDGALRLVHDPFLGGERLEDLLDVYRHAFIIFNTKCDGIAKRVLALAEKHGIEDYFLLDLANPTLINLSQQGVRNIAVRYSEFEPIEFALAFAGRVEWVWVDCFTHLPLNPESYWRLRKHFKLCLVSPEMQNHPRRTIQTFRTQLQSMPIDAICSDYCEDWL